METTKETPKEESDIIFKLLNEKAQDGEEDRWQSWHDAHQQEAMRQMRNQMDPKAINSNTYALALHIGLLAVHGSSHPLYYKLSDEEMEDLKKMLAAAKRLFNPATDGGIYGTFYTRLNAAR